MTAQESFLGYVATGRMKCTNACHGIQVCQIVPNQSGAISLTPTEKITTKRGVGRETRHDKGKEPTGLRTYLLGKPLTGVISARAMRAAVEDDAFLEVHR